MGRKLRITQFQSELNKSCHLATLGKSSEDLSAVIKLLRDKADRFQSFIARRVEPQSLFDEEERCDAPKELALEAAVNAIYFDDSSDFRSALWTIVRHLDPELAQLLEDNERAAYEAMQQRLEKFSV